MLLETVTTIQKEQRGLHSGEGKKVRTDPQLMMLGQNNTRHNG